MAQVYPHLHVVILCESYGAQLWPIAHEDAPVFLTPSADDSDESLLAAAVRRGAPYSPYPIHVVAPSRLADAVQDELAVCEQAVEGGVDLLSLPAERGSAFALALACARIRRQDPQAVVLTLHADQRVELDDRWERTIYRAYQIALQDHIVVLGGQQRSKCLDYSYIRKGRPLEGVDGAFEVRSFTAGQSRSTALRQREQGALWHTGCLICRAAVVLGELARAGEMAATPESAESLRIAEAANFLALLEPKEWRGTDAQEFIASLPAVSFAKAVLEVSSRLVVIPTTMLFAAIRTLADLDALVEPTREGNRCIGDDAAAFQCRNTTVYAKGAGRPVVAFGLRDAIVVGTADATLVISRDQADSAQQANALYEAVSGCR